MCDIITGVCWESVFLCDCEIGKTCETRKRITWHQGRLSMLISKTKPMCVTPGFDGLDNQHGHLPGFLSFLVLPHPRMHHPHLHVAVHQLYAAIHARAKNLMIEVAHFTRDEQEALRYATALAQSSRGWATEGFSDVSFAPTNRAAILVEHEHGKGASKLFGDREQQGGDVAAAYYSGEADEADDYVMDDREVALKMM